MLKENIDNSDTGVVHYLQKSSSGRVTALVLKMDKIDPDTGTNELRFIDITKKRPAMRHAWAGTIYKAQGGSVPFARLVVTNSSMDANTIYVAASRHKVNFKMFLSKEFMDTSLNKIKHQDISEKQKKKLTWLKDEKKIDIPEVAFESYGQADFYLKNYVDVQLPDPADRTHAMDNFSEVITRMSKFTFKSNVADFTEIENGAKLLKDIEAARLEDMAMFRNNRGKLVPVEKPVTSESSFGTKSRAAKMRAKKAQEKAAKVIPQLPIDPIKKQKRASLAKGI